MIENPIMNREKSLCSQSRDIKNAIIMCELLNVLRDDEREMIDD